MKIEIKSAFIILFTNVSGFDGDDVVICREIENCKKSELFYEMNSILDIEEDKLSFYGAFKRTDYKSAINKMIHFVDKDKTDVKSNEEVENLIEKAVCELETEIRGFVASIKNVSSKNKVDRLLVLYK